MHGFENQKLILRFFFQNDKLNCDMKSRQFSTLSDLPEGQIGKLKTYKSGKIELCFGDHKLLVSTGTQVGFLQVSFYH